MDRKPVAELIASLTSMLKDGMSYWNGYIFLKDTCNLSKSSATVDPVVQNCLQDLFHNGTNISDVTVRSYLRKKGDEKRFVSITPNNVSTPHNGNEFFHGSPLKLQDNLGDLSSIDSIVLDNSVDVMDHSYLVPESAFSRMMSCICCAVNTHEFEENCNWNTLLKSVFPIVVFCKYLDSGDDTNGIILVDFKTDSTDKVCGFVVKKVRVVGKFPYDNWCGKGSQSTAEHTSLDRSQNHLNSIQFVSDAHSSNILSKRSATKMESYAIYELQESGKLPETSIETAGSYAAVSVACDQVKEILTVNTQHISRVQIHISPCPGDKSSPTRPFYDDILIVKRLFLAWDEEETGWTLDSGVPKGTSTTLDDVEEFLASYNQEWKIWRSFQKVDDPEAANNDHVASTVMLQDRTELDFTERMWGVLKKMTSEGELIKSLDMIFAKIRSGGNAQLWLHSNNHTSIAKLVRESYSGKVSATPNLTIKTAVLLLIEVALDKMRRDYRNFFVSNRIVAGSCLDAYKPPEGPEVSCDGFPRFLREQFEMVQKLHHVVEFVVQCKGLFSLPDEAVFSEARNILRRYSTEKRDFDKTFVFGVDYEAVSWMVMDRPPSLWKLIASTADRNEKRSTCCTWTPEYPFRGVLSAPAHTDGGDGGKEYSVAYYVALQTSAYLPINPFSAPDFKNLRWSN